MKRPNLCMSQRRKANHAKNRPFRSFSPGFSSFELAFAITTFSLGHSHCSKPIINYEGERPFSYKERAVVVFSAAEMIQ